MENGKITSELLLVIAANDSVTCALNTKENNFLEKLGWQRFKHLAKREKRLRCLQNQSKLRSCHTFQRFKCGCEAPKNNSYEHDIQLYDSSKKTKWKDAIAAELDQQMECEACKDLGLKSKSKPTPGFKKIRDNFVCDVKRDGSYKPRLVEDGYPTEVSLALD